MKPDVLRVLVGPTAVGKSELALQWAEQHNGEIVTVDSAQVFRGLDIGTAKPSAADRARVPHHIVDLIEADERLDASHYAKLADAAIVDICARGKTPIIVGGTGLWLRALIRGIFNVPNIDDAVRLGVQAELTERGSRALHAELEEHDPVAASRIKSTDPQRITRALEVFRQTGTPISALQAAHGFKEARYRMFGVVVDRPRLEVWARIETRTQAMYGGGLLEETQRALDRGIGPQSPGLSIIGYRDAVLHLSGELDRAEAERRTTIATRRYAKRQRNWFRSEPKLVWCSAEMTAGALQAQFEEFASHGTKA